MIKNNASGRAPFFSKAPDGEMGAGNSFPGESGDLNN